MSKKHKEARKRKEEVQTAVSNMERTGTNTFNVKHDDGSTFECQVDDPKKFDALAGVSSLGKKSIAVSGFRTKKKPLICDECNKIVYKVRITNNRSLCDHCS